MSFWRKDRGDKPGRRRDSVDVALEMAAERPGCPLCTVSGQSRHRLLWALLWEYVNDVKVRRRFIDAGGFCAADSRLLLDIARREIGISHGMAILYKNLVEVAAGALQPRPRYRPTWMNVRARRFEPGKACPACSRTARSAPGYAARLCAVAGGSSSIRMDSAFPLCREHFQTCLRAAADEPTRRVLAADQREGISRLYGQIKKALQGEQSIPEALSGRFLAAACRTDTPQGTLAGNGPPDPGGGPAAAYSCPLCQATSVLPYAPRRLNDPAAAAASVCHAHASLKAMNGLVDNRHELLEFLASRAVDDLTAMESDESGRSRSRKHSPAPPEDAPCPFCRDLAEAQRQALERLLAQLSEGEMPDGLLLCLDHLGPVLARLPADRAGLLVAQQRAGLERLSADLQEFIESHDYRYRGVLSPEAKSALLRALRVFASRGA
ncbi:MAG: hypothetical protein HY673_15745 [Chloroflexi bacterium]|nr:hypothetical protein [Chloroflexota bacterium]